jgi:hypothetical protein
MWDRDKFQQYRAFCDGLKDSLSMFEVWEVAQSEGTNPGVLVAQAAQRMLRGKEYPQAVGAPQAKAAGDKGKPVVRAGGWGAVRDRTLEALQSGPKRCNEVVAEVIRLSPADQQPRGKAEEKNHYTTVNNGLSAMSNSQFVVKEKREVSEGKTATFWVITEKGQTYLTNLKK